jgi:hypothetical protein
MLDVRRRPRPPAAARPVAVSIPSEPSASRQEQPVRHWMCGGAPPPAAAAARPVAVSSVASRCRLD